jgi:hypothetical protein
MSRSARIWFVVAPQVVTFVVNVPARFPGARMATFASRLEISIPAALSWIRSMATSRSTYSFGLGACRGEGGMKSGI